MSTRWKASHEFATPIPYGSGPTAYATIGVTLVLKGQQIVQADHEFATDDGLSEGEVAGISREALGVVFELLTYLSGQTTRGGKIVLEPLQVGVPAAQTTMLFALPGTARIVTPTRLPAENQLLADQRLRTWLNLANEARRPASDVDAIRNYYMIWEDMFGRPQKGSGAAEELKFVRDFVSHGSVGNSDLLSFLNRELGPGPTPRPYEPLNPAHQTFLTTRREWARGLVEGEINKRL